MRRALLHSGGNARGAVAIATLFGLRDRYGLAAYAAGAGVSVGAVNVPMFFEGKLDQLANVYEEVDGTGFYMRPNVEHLRRGVFSLKPLRKRMKKLSNRGDLPRGVPVYAGVYDFQSDRYRSIQADAMPDDKAWLDARMASCAQPVIMEGWDVQVRPGRRHLCFDGGMRHVIPQLPSWETYDAIDVILCSPLERKDYKPKKDVDRILEIAARSIEVWTDGVVKGDIGRLRAWAGKVPVTLYAPKDAGAAFDASPETMQWRLHEVGPAMWENPIRL